jgi:histone H3/H4
MAELPLSSITRIMKSAGVGRCSKEAKEYLREMVESYARAVGEEAAKIAELAGRETVKGDDIRFAAKRIR